MAYDRRCLLIALASRGALEHTLDLRTVDLAEWIGTSQQTASIYLTRLANEGLVERTSKRRGSRIRMTEKGLEELQSLHRSLNGIFGSDRSILIKGRTSSGLGEGAYYLGQSGYIEQIERYLGFIPFPGTLNIVLGPADAPVIDLLRKGPGIPISDFVAEGRTFGMCICYKCTVNGHPGAVMIPIRTIHRNTLEIISAVRLRDELGLKDDDAVELVIHYPGGSGSGTARSSGDTAPSPWP